MDYLEMLLALNKETQMGAVEVLAPVAGQLLGGLAGSLSGSRGAEVSQDAVAELKEFIGNCVKDLIAVAIASDSVAPMPIGASREQEDAWLGAVESNFVAARRMIHNEDWKKFLGY